MVMAKLEDSGSILDECVNDVQFTVSNLLECLL